MPDILVKARKSPLQARSSATVTAILDAAARVLSEHSLSGFNTNHVALIAGVSIGSLYQYFPNKSALIAALIERTQSELASAIEQSIGKTQGLPLAEVLDGLIDVAIAHQFGNPKLAAALDHEEVRLPISEILSTAQQRIVQAIQTALNQHAELVQVKVSVPMTADCLTIAKALIESEASLAKPKLVELRQRVRRALLGYLGA